MHEMSVIYQGAINDYLKKMSKMKNALSDQVSSQYCSQFFSMKLFLQQ